MGKEGGRKGCVGGWVGGRIERREKGRSKVGEGGRKMREGGGEERRERKGREEDCMSEGRDERSRGWRNKKCGI